MIESIVLIAIIWFAFVSIITFIFFSEEGTKGIEKEPYYGRKTGTIYTAKKERSDYIL